jgi:hypothetical protein
MTFVDADHPDVVAFAARATAGASTDRDKAVALVRERGTFDELPFEAIMSEFRPAFARMLEEAPPVDAAFRPT